jgi:hypothetical protein
MRVGPAGGEMRFELGKIPFTWDGSVISLVLRPEGFSRRLPAGRQGLGRVGHGSRCEPDGEVPSRFLFFHQRGA